MAGKQSTALSPFQDAARQLAQQSALHDTCLVAFSGGKDSLCCLDLCVRAFKRVVGVYQYFVPGLQVVEEQIAYASKRWGVEIVQYPSYVFIEAIAHGLFTWMPRKDRFVAMEGIRREEYWEVIKKDLGIDLLATGQKEADFWQRRSSLRRQERDGRQGFFHPLRKWSLPDILAYLQAHNIPLPPSSGKISTGVGLSTPSLCWLYDNYPEDFARMEQWFPFCRAVILRREWYGVGKEKPARKKKQQEAQTNG